MADEKVVADGEAAPKKSKAGLIIGIVCVVLIAAGVGAGIYFGTKSQVKVPAPHRKTDKPIIIALDDMYVNIAETKATRILKITPVLEVSDAALMAVIAETYRPIIRDHISEAASRMTIDELEGRNGRGILKREIKNRLNVLFRERMAGAVVEVYFADFLIQ
jgi:flagellar basal body-associated protein FliL